MTAALQAYRIRVPADWVEFDVWRATRTGDVARLVDARVAEDRRLAPHRGALMKALREAAIQAEAQGAGVCAAMLQPIEGSLLAAVLTVLSTTGADGDQPVSVDEIAAGITAVAPSAASPLWRRVELATLAGGPAVRVCGVERVSFGARSTDCVTMQTLVPAPGGGVVNVVLSSPQTELVDAWLDLFDAVTSTFTWAGDD